MDDLKLGDRVIFDWGLAKVVGTVLELYGPAARPHVVVELSPDVSGDVVDEPTTVSLPVSATRRADVAA